VARECRRVTRKAFDGDPDGRPFPAADEAVFPAPRERRHDGERHAGGSDEAAPQSKADAGPEGRDNAFLRARSLVLDGDEGDADPGW